MAFILGSLDNAVLGSAFMAASKPSVGGDLRSSSPASAVFQLPLCELSCSDCESPSVILFSSDCAEERTAMGISLLWKFESLFGCHHQQLSRVSTIGRRTYQVCVECRREFEYSWKLMHSMRSSVADNAYAHC
jgi:hypothetical protein